MTCVQEEGLTAYMTSGFGGRRGAFLRKENWNICLRKVYADRIFSALEKMKKPDLS